MKLSLGIVGLPNVGKSTLFKALTNNDVKIANYPFATIDPNVGVVQVPDDRLGKLAELSKSAKIVPAIVEFYDIAGLVKGASAGEGLGNQFLNHIKEVDAIVEVLRCFPESEIIHVENSVDPLRDLEIINAELALKDLESIEKAFKKIEGDAKSGDKEAAKALEIISAYKSLLEKGALLFAHAPVDNTRIKELNLLTAKPQIYLLNGEEKDVPEALVTKIKELGASFVTVDLSQNPDLTELVRRAYDVLGLISFFTTGEDETRAWTIRKGSTAPEASGAIHTDFKDKFIRAEVIHWEELLAVGGWSLAKQKGKLRIEGKEYVVQDGDVIVVRHGA